MFSSQSAHADGCILHHHTEPIVYYYSHVQFQLICNLSQLAVAIGKKVSELRLVGYFDPRTLPQQFTSRQFRVKSARLCYANHLGF